MSALIPAYALRTSGGAGGPVAGPLHAGRAYIKIEDPDAAFDALLTGQIDVMSLARPDQIDRAREAGFTITKEPAQSWQDSFYFNFQRNITNDLGFRKAVAHLYPKDELFSTLYGPLMEYGISVLGPAYGKWYNPNVEDNTAYDPDLAAFLLDEAGYTLNPATGIRIDPATGTDMRTLDLMYYTEVPQVVAETERLRDEMKAVGIPVKLTPAPFGTGEWWNKALTGDFDITIIGVSWTGYPEGIYVIWDSHSPPDWLNFQRYSNPEFDAQMDIFHNSLNETEVVDAVWKAQEILAEDVAIIMGGYPVTYTAYSDEWTGMIEAPFESYTEALRIRRKDGDLTKFLRIRTVDEPASQVTGYDPHAIADVYNDFVTHNVIVENNPFLGPYVPWLAKSWKLEPWTDPAQGVTKGTKLTVTIADGIKWQDGFPYTADDYVFAALYGRDKSIPRASMTADGLVDAKAINPTTVECYYNKTKLFILDDQYYVNSFPKHIYNDNVTLYGEPAGPTDLQVPGKYGVPDPSTFNAFKVQNPFNSSLTCFVGTGPYIYLLGGWNPGVSFTLVANRDYFKSILVSDTNFDFKIDIKDIFTVAKAFGSEVGKPRWDVNADINGDHKVDIKDIFAVAKDFGKTW